MTDNYEIRSPENFVAGTIGGPGERIFYLQAQGEDSVLTLKVEKGQVQSLASHLLELIEAKDADVVAAQVVDMVEPPNAVWTVGALAIGLSDEPGEIVVVAQELSDEDQNDPSEAHIHISFEQAKAFVDHALFLIEYGRDFGRQNGHKRIGE
ncbi:MAG: DUF3090 family protein [Candidatus Poriferisodalaceae bacterium]|nr:MAG: hypothetical protein CNE88_04050 [Acidimicrobiales bacterium MED-G01]|tara:strand:+ start:417 stop:872 length:456 start_codon:yes stop_codon:yes gene_type:complete